MKISWQKLSGLIGAILLAMAGLTGLAQAQGGSNPTPAPTPLPFRLPFVEPAGPQTWLMAQPYGNTIGAYYQRHTTYGASGGIHFGLDLAAPCGAEIVAIADGVVFAVDGPFGSPPHNLMIDHPELGYASMYGHLLEPPELSPGQPVRQGQVIALVGDSGGDCNRSPHLHLEIRDLTHIRKFNPVTLIEADWHRLARYGPSGRGFMRDLSEPRKWQQIYDQPQAQTGGPIINDFSETWPLDWDRRPAGGPRPTPIATPTPSPTPGPEAPSLTPTAPPATPTPPLPAGVYQLTQGDCCTNPYWNKESTQIRFVDKPSPGAAVGVWGVNVDDPAAGPQLVTDRLGVYSQVGDLVAYPDRERGLTIVERLADGEQWEIDTGESGVAFTPDGKLLWAVYDSEAPWRSRESEIWVANTDGQNPAKVATLRRGGPVAWLSETTLLVSRRLPPSQDTLLSRLSLEDGRQTELVRLPRIRSATLSPDKRYLAYLIRFNANGKENGLWLVDLEAADPTPEKLPFFGAYRWQDEQRLIYIPFSAETPVFYEYNVETGQSRRLFPALDQELPLTIANNDWDISPDGRKISLVAAQDAELNGVWVIELGND